MLSQIVSEELTIAYGVLGGVAGGFVGVAGGVAGGGAGVAGAAVVGLAVGEAGVSVACSPQAAKVKAKPSPKTTVKNFLFIHSS